MQKLAVLNDLLFDNVVFWSNKTPNKIFLRVISLNTEEFITYSQAVKKIIDLSSCLENIVATNIGLVLNNDIETIIMFYAILKSKNNVILIDPLWGAGIIDNVLQTANITSIMSSTGCENDRLNRIRIDINAENKLVSHDHENREVAHGKVIVFTSGTTSEPKGVVLSQSALIYAYRLGIDCLNIDDKYSSGCFYRISGLGILGINFLFIHVAGGTGNLLPEFSYFNEDKLHYYVNKYNINFLYIVPPIVNYIIENYSSTSKTWLQNILNISSSAKLTKKAQDIFQSKFGSLANIYGLTECGFAFLFGHKSGQLFTNSVGKARGLKLKLLDNDFHEIRKPYVNGRLYVDTPSIFEGYYHNIEKTKEIMLDGWLDTRDIAYFDDEGCVFLIGRADDTINKGGNLFHLSEADEVFLGLPGVIDACGVKIDCPYYEHDYVMCLYVNNLFDKQTVMLIAEQKLGIHRSPKKVIYFDKEMPRNGAGKYDRSKLKELVNQS